MNQKSRLFVGQFEHGVDDKNRLFLPARFRENKNASFVLTQGLENCLFLFPVSAWDDLAAKLSQLPLKDKTEERAFKRILLSGASEVSVDGQGRILIPTVLKDYAGIRRDAMVIGLLHHVEIWAKHVWTAYEKKARTSFERVAPELAL